MMIQVVLANCTNQLSVRSSDKTNGRVDDVLSTSNVIVDCADALQYLSFATAINLPAHDLLSGYLILKSWGKPYPPENSSFTASTYIGSYGDCIGTQQQLDMSYCIYDMQIGPDLDMSHDLASTIPIAIKEGNKNSDRSLSLVNIAGEVCSRAISIISTRPSSCPTVDVSYDVSAKLTLMVCVVLCSLVIIGTVLDFVLKDTIDRGQHEMVIVGTINLLTSFSLVKTISLVFTTKPSSASLKAIGGIRVMSMLWIIANHTWQAVNTYSEYVVNKSAASNKVKEFSFQPIVNVTFAVETFILLGGLLVAYTTFNDMEKHGKFRILYFYVYRLFRISSLYYLFIFVAIRVIPKLGSRPVYNWRMISYDTCQQYWWTNILYINNIVPVLSCLGHTWYMALDMQFFIISPLFVVLLYTNRRIGLGIMATVMIISVAIVGVITAINKHNANLFADPDFVSNIKYLYCKPYFRINAYLIGILLGYILYKKYTFHVSSTMPAVLCLPVIYGTYKIWHDKPFSEFENLMYQMFSRTAWSAGIAVLIYNCNQNNNFIQKSANRVLSWKGWDPLVNLTFAAYLIHYVVLDYIMGLMHTPYVFNDNVYMVLFMATTIISYLVAILMTLCVELPMINVVKILFQVAGIQPREKLCN